MLIWLYGLRGHIGMGVSELEAGILSGEACLREIPESLRHAFEHRGSELHVSPLPDREVTARVDCGHARELSVCDQGAPENHARCQAARRRGFHFGFSALFAAARRKKEIGPRAVSAAAILEVRRSEEH